MLTQSHSLFALWLLWNCVFSSFWVQHKPSPRLGTLVWLESGMQLIYPGYELDALYKNSYSKDL